MSASGGVGGGYWSRLSMSWSRYKSANSIALHATRQMSANNLTTLVDLFNDRNDEPQLIDDTIQTYHLVKLVIRYFLQP